MGRREARAVAAVVSALFVVTVVLLFFGTRGAEIANVVALFVGGVGTLATVLIWLRPATQNSEPAHSSPPHRPHWTLMFVGALTLLATLLAAFLVFGTGSFPGSGGGSRTPSSTAVPGTTAPFDDFIEPKIDTSKWRVDDPQDIFTQERGALFISAKAAGDSSITAIPQQPTNTIRATVRVQSATGTGQGGLSLALVGAEGQRRVLFGPGATPGSLEYHIESCPDAACADPTERGAGSVRRGVEQTVVISAQADATVVTVPDASPVVLDALGAVSDRRIEVLTPPDGAIQAEVDGVDLLQK